MGKCSEHGDFNGRRCPDCADELLDGERRATVKLTAENTRLAARVEELESYYKAVDDALIVNCIGTATGDGLADLAKLIKCEIDMALDPAISSRAKALLTTGGQDEDE